MLKVTTPRETVTDQTSVLLYSGAGHGKTLFLSTAQDDPRTSPMLLLDYDGGLRTIADRDDIAVIDLKATLDTGLEVRLNEIHDTLMRKDCPYKSVAIDSLSELYYARLLALAAESALRNPKLAPNEVSKRDYGRVAVELRRQIRAFRNLPIHVFMTALSRTVTDERSGASRTGPALGGQLFDQVPGLFDVVAYLALGDDLDDGSRQRVLLLQSTYPWIAKVRHPFGQNPPAMLEDPTVTTLLDAIDLAPARKETRRKTS